MTYLEEVKEICDQLDQTEIQRLVDELSQLKGRLFVLGVGGSAANASHCVNDFRKLCGIEAYAPTDNVAELTARTNDEGWDSVFYDWLAASNINSDDIVLILSVGGGDLERNVSGGLVYGIQKAREVGAKVLGIVGRDGGYTKKVADACVVIPTVNPDHVTPHTEAFQLVISHLITWQLKVNQSKW